MGDDVLAVGLLLAADPLTTIGSVLGIGTGIVAIIGGIAAALGGRRRAKDRAAADLAEEFRKGAASRDPDIRQMCSDYDNRIRLLESEKADMKDERNEARRDRDEARRTLALMQNPVADWRRGDMPPPAPHPRPGSS